jgi:hypothetical protein
VIAFGHGWRPEGARVATRQITVCARQDTFLPDNRAKHSTLRIFQSARTYQKLLRQLAILSYGPGDIPRDHIKPSG